jgi:hypothetical protein
MSCDFVMHVGYMDSGFDFNCSHILAHSHKFKDLPILGRFCKKLRRQGAQGIRNDAYDEVMRYVAVTSFGAQSSMRAVYETAVW